MLPTEQPRFFELVTQALAAFGKYPEQRDLEAWWRECKGLSLDGLEAALKSHRDDPDRGERAPRPVDITRRMKSGSADARRCAARDHTGQCEYPGIFGEATNGEGLWYCPWHRQDRAGPEATLWIERSREIPWDIASARRIERMLSESIRARPVVNLAHTIARRHGAKPWQNGLRLPFNGELSTDEERIADQGSLDNRDVA
jgi:hypothetical protein